MQRFLPYYRDASYAEIGTDREHRPGAHSIHAFRMVYDFNLEVQFDIMFYKSILKPTRGPLNIVHLIDVSIRFSVATICPPSQRLI